MPAGLILLLVLIAAELNVWMLAWAMLVGLFDAGLIGAVGLYAWVRLAAE